MSEPINKILVLGNGFDLAHYLPTKYDHFMTAMQAIVKSQNKEINFDELFADYLKNNDEFFLRAKELYKTDEFKLSECLVIDFKERLKNNSWFKYFSKYLENVETWIDFESEIEKTLVFTSNLLIDINEKNFSAEKLSVYDTDDVVNFYWLENKLDIDIVYNFLDIFKIKNSVYHRYNCDSNGNIYDYTNITESEYDKCKKLEIQGEEYFEENIGFRSIDIIDKNLLSRYGDRYISLKESEIFKILKNQLNYFKDIFSLYISDIIEKLEPKKSFKPIDRLGKEFSAVFTFNYSESFQRFYRPSLKVINKVQHLHGNTKSGNIVLGIDDLNDDLKPYKIYDFVKTYQKIINNTDYQFLDDRNLGFNTKPIAVSYDELYKYPPYEITIWGHSLDISDREYVQDIFKLNTLNAPYQASLVIWYYGTPHNSLVNLIHIMGKDIIQNWVKKGWLKFEKMPDIYALNKSDENEN